jgi:hypothetical protein
MNARQPPKAEMSRAPVVAEPFTLRPSAVVSFTVHSNSL